MTTSRLSRIQQEQVFKLRTHNLSYREIAQLVDCSKDQVYRLLLPTRQQQQQESVLKATALGITRDDEWRDRQVCIVVGPNIDLSVKLIKRIRPDISEVPQDL